MILRLATKLAKKLKEKPNEWPREELAPSPFVDWSATLFTANRSQHILLCNTPTLYSRVFYGRGIPDLDTFLRRMHEEIRESFLELDLEQLYEQQIAQNSSGVFLSKALNRRITGCMTELVKAAKWSLEEKPDQPLDRLNTYLNSILLSTLGEKPGDYGKPGEEFKRLAKAYYHPNVIPFRRREDR